MRLKQLRISGLFLSIAIVATAFAQQPIPDVQKLRTHITYLASDNLDGRRTGTAGAQLAAEYIAREFSRYGLQRSIGWDTPGMSILEADSPNRYLQKFPYVAGVELGKNNTLSIQSENAGLLTARPGEDWMALALSSSGNIQNAEAVFVGYGITANELKYDDYQSGRASGKIAVALSGTPDGENPHGQFAQYEDVRWKAIAARNAGAKALVIIARAQNFKDDRLATLHYDHGAGDAGLPVVAISRSLAAKLFEANGVKNFAQFVEQVSSALAQQGVKDIRGYSVNLSFGFDLLRNNKVSLSTEIVRREVEAANVVGIVNGFDPVLKNEFIVIGAHYDHLGRGGEGSLTPREGDIHHGADDNASGTAGLLELARIFASSDSPRPRRTIVFIAFSGEEEGLLGSNYYVNHPLRPLENTVAMINMDMIGRMKNNKLIVGGVGTADGWRKILDSSAKFWGIGVTPVPASYGKPLSGELTAKPDSS